MEGILRTGEGYINPRTHFREGEKSQHGLGNDTYGAPGADVHPAQV